MARVSDVKFVENKLVVNDALSKIFKCMEKYGIRAPQKLLSPVTTHTAKFSISKSFAGFANAVRRVLIGEIPTTSLTVAETDINTDDHFIISDVVISAVQLCIIDQDCKEYPKQISLHVTNTTNDVISVTSADIKCAKGPDCITHKNLILFSLRPGCYIDLPKITIAQGVADDDAGRYSLLSNVSYTPTDVEPYNQFTDRGQRSMNSTPAAFDISFTTAGNIKPASVMRQVCDVLQAKLDFAAHHLTQYKKSKDYHHENFDVSCDAEGLSAYVFHGEYFTLVNWLAHQCYQLDPSIAYCAATVDRYDNSHGIIRIRAPQPTEMLLAACSACEADLQTLRAAFVKKIK